MALVAADGPLFAEVDMGADSSAPTVRATVVQASTIFYDTPATLGIGFATTKMLIKMKILIIFVHIIVLQIRQKDCWLKRRAMAPS